MVSLGGTRIVVATQPVDFRKGHDGLAAVVHNELGLDPYSGVAYVFRAKRADRIKVLWWDGTGLVAVGAGPVCVADGPQRGDEAHPGAVRGAVRGSGLAPDVEPARAAPARGGVTAQGVVQP